jgi:hypothetical protein
MFVRGIHAWNQQQGQMDVTFGTDLGEVCLVMSRDRLRSFEPEASTDLSFGPAPN